MCWETHSGGNIFSTGTKDLPETKQHWSENTSFFTLEEGFLQKQMYKKLPERWFSIEKECFEERCFVKRSLAPVASGRIVENTFMVWGVMFWEAIMTVGRTSPVFWERLYALKLDALGNHPCCQWHLADWLRKVVWSTNDVSGNHSERKLHLKSLSRTLVSLENDVL